MNTFRTEIYPDKSKFEIEPSSKIFTIGSCFANNMGEKFSDNYFSCLTNPYGVLYNPISIANTLNLIARGYTFDENDLQFHNNTWLSFNHHSIFNSPDKKEILTNVNTVNKKSNAFLKESNILFITFGTAWIYKIAGTDTTVSNCHKYPSKYFDRHKLDIDEIVSYFKQAIESLHDLNNNLKIIFTVSPIRHWKDGAHENQLSKASLLLSIDELVKEYSFCSYFPSYELVLDDLRDYRFYNEDMVHPNSTAVKYIWNKLLESNFSENCKEYIKVVSKIRKDLNHRPFNPDSEQHKSFINKLNIRIKELVNRYKHLNQSDFL